MTLRDIVNIEFGARYQSHPSLYTEMHGFLKKVNSFGKTALTTAGTAHTLFQADKAVYDFGKVAAPVIAGLL